MKRAFDDKWGYIPTNSERINGSGLFWWNSSMTEDEKLKIVDWFDDLSSTEQDFVRKLRQEARDDDKDSILDQLPNAL